MPLLNKFLSTTRRKINNKHQDYCKLPLKIEKTNHDKNILEFDGHHVRILLFRECEWRGRKLLFDSITAGQNNTASINDCNKKCNNNTDSCPRNGNGLPQENEKNPCDNVSLLSEMIFGTVAMTYRGPLFKVHTFDSPRSIMCTKVFPASDHNSYKHSGRLSVDVLGTFPNNLESNSSNGNTRNTLSTPSSGNFSGNSLRKSSTCSSTCSGWDIDIPLLASSQSLESNSSSGFGSLSSLRRRWLRAMSTSLSHCESDEIFRFQSYGDYSGDTCDINARRHKTRLGLAILIKLTPGKERWMEIRLLEHAAQLEAILNRLCYACIEPTRNKMNGVNNGLIHRMHRASYKCTLRLFRLLLHNENVGVPSIWHEILLNTTLCMELRLNTLYRSFQQMCQLLNTIDTKSTNFFLSTVVTAVLTYHLGWVNTVISPRDKTWVENVKKKFPCNPLWAQLSDLYGTLGNPAKHVHTVIFGDEDKVQLINAILTFLSYFLRSAMVKRHNEIRDASDNDVKEAIAIIQRKKRKNSSIIVNTLNRSHSSVRGNINNSNNCYTSNSYNNKNDEHDEDDDDDDDDNDNGESSGSNRLKTLSCKGTTRSFTKQINFIKSQHDELFDENGDNNKLPNNLNIPRLRKTSSLSTNLDRQNSNVLTSDYKLPLKLELNQDDLTNISQSINNIDKDRTSSSVKIIVSQIADEAFDHEKLSSITSTFDGLERKNERREQELLSIPPKLSFLHNSMENNFEVSKLNVNHGENTGVYFTHVEYTDIKQENSVSFTLGDEEKSATSISNSSSQSIIDSVNCQCPFAFTRVPSTSAELPEGILRKIIQRNFPESSESIQRPSVMSLSGKKRTIGFCPKCNGNGNNYEADDKLLLETPTNATEVLRTCSSSVSSRGGSRPRCVDTLEELLEANDVIELPMPRSKNINELPEEIKNMSGFTETLMQRTVTKPFSNSNNFLFNDSGYNSGLVIQGLIKKRGRRKNDESNNENELLNDSINDCRWINSNDNLIGELREEVAINARFPIVDQPISEALCIMANVDNWRVEIISNNMIAPSQSLPVGMSRLVSNMLEAFVYLWTKYHSPAHCLNILECKLREMWLRSEALAEMLMTTDVCKISLTNLTNALDLDAADIPLLLAVAQTHSPQLAQRIGLTFT